MKIKYPEQPDPGVATLMRSLDLPGFGPTTQPPLAMGHPLTTAGGMTTERPWKYS